MVARARRSNCVDCSSSSWLTRVSDVRGDDISARDEYWAFRLTKIMEYRRCSLRLDVGELHHFRPFLGFIGYELAELGWRNCKYRAAQVGDPRLDGGVGEARVHLPI